MICWLFWDAYAAAAIGYNGGAQELKPNLIKSAGIVISWGFDSWFFQPVWS